MRTRTATITCLLALAVTTGCSSDSDDKPADPPATSAVASPAAPLDQATARQACVEAVAEIPAGDNGEVPSEPIPEECTTLSASDYLDAYMDGIEQSNQEGQDALQDLIDQATESAQP
jgi:hypothetical protein